MKIKGFAVKKQNKTAGNSEKAEENSPALFSIMYYE